MAHAWAREALPRMRNGLLSPARSVQWLAPRSAFHRCLHAQSSESPGRQAETLPLGGRASQAKARIAAIDARVSAPPSPLLKDRYNRQHTYLRISLTERCNLRCVYCMPEEGVTLTPKPELLTTAEVQRLAELFVRSGVDKIRLTGGEPTVRRDLEDIVGGLNELRRDGLKAIGMTSNGMALARRLPALVQNGLSHLNVSLDTFDPFKFELLTRRPPGTLDAVLKSLDVAQALGMQSVKINAVVLKGVNDSPEELRRFVEYTRDRDVVIRFIEYMPFDGNKWQTSKLVPYQQLLATFKSMYGELERLRDDDNDTSKGWRVPGHQGSIGFITSMTDHFCGTCNRLRITADGNLKVCLFGSSEVSLRDVLRGSGANGEATEEELLRVIGAAVGRKHAKHAGTRGQERSTTLRGTTRRPTILPVRGAGRLGPVGSHARFFSSGRNYDDDDYDPWASLDAQFQQPKAAQRPPPHASNPDSHFSRSAAQTWSEYMGSVDDDDNPWANLDAFAESATTIPKTEALRSTAQLPPTEVSRSRKPPSASAPSADPERAAMEKVVAMMLARESPAELPRTRAEPSVTRQLQSRPTAARAGLTHIDSASGTARMVDVSNKTSTSRSATAQGRVWLPREAMNAVRATEQGSASLLSKGPVLQTARLAGIMGAKRTSDLIPLCHPLPLSNVHVELKYDDDEQLEPEGGYLVIECTASTTGPTGVEMEALTGVSVACLTIWDMTKALAGREMVIEGLKVTRKSGGKSGDWTRED